MFDTDIAIVGGGLTGTALALALRDSGWRIALVEAAAPPTRQPALTSLPAQGPEDFDTRVSALTLRTQRFLHQIGAWEMVASSRYCPYRHMTVWDADGTGAIDFDAAELDAEALGFLVENRIIQQALNAGLMASGVQVLWQHPVADCELESTGTPRLRFAYGGELRCRLLVAADGGRSPLRQALGFATRQWSYEQHAIVATVQTALPHGSTAWQRFLPSGPLAFLPLGGDHDQRFSSIVWSVDSHLEPELTALDEAAFRNSLGSAFEHRLGSIEAIGSRQSFPLRQIHAIDYVKPGVALLGDAAHVIHPLAGQGVNLGFADAAVLAEELHWAARRGLGPGEMAVLQRYQRRRKGDNLAMMGAMEGYKRLFGHQNLALRWLRNAGLRGVARLPPLKHLMMRRAMGVE